MKIKLADDQVCASETLAHFTFSFLKMKVPVWGKQQKTQGNKRKRTKGNKPDWNRTQEGKSESKVLNAPPRKLLTDMNQKKHWSQTRHMLNKRKRERQVFASYTTLNSHENQEKKRINTIYLHLDHVGKRNEYIFACRSLTRKKMDGKKYVCPYMDI